MSIVIRRATNGDIGQICRLECMFFWQDKNPEEIVPIKPVYKYYLEIWQHFLNECQTRKAELPHAPIWAMEFGANYDFEDKAPAFQSLAQLKGRCGKLGIIIDGKTKEECINQLPNYAQTDKTSIFPDMP